MKTYTKYQALEIMNQWGRDRRPFLFAIDFEMEKIILHLIDDLTDEVLYDFNGISNTNKIPLQKELSLEKKPMPYGEYEIAFNGAIEELNYGNSFLLNLTFPTQVKTNLSLEEVFYAAKAKYKLYVKNKFVCYSPEIFVQIKDGYIYSYPMKGTIDATIPGAKEKILADEKELSEHYTIVDLIRNDLSIVAENVDVTKFRFIDEIKTTEKHLLQVSSEIRGELSDDFFDNLGTHLFDLLPAGSISGAPKKKTVEIIQDLEQSSRGYYTGITGVFDGKELDSGVMIRFLEQNDQGMFYRSGCGITYMSQCQKEYDEMIDKVYIPK